MYGAKELKLDLCDMQVDYIRFGKGPRTMVMIQGLNTRGIRGSALPLAYMYRKFVKDYTVYLFERRPEVDEGITVRDMAADIARAMDALGLRRADVFGVSQGGMIAQYLAIDRPDLVGKLVLAVTLAKSNDTVIDAVNGWIRMAESGDMKSLVADMAERMYSEAYLRKCRPLLPLLTAVQRPRDVRRFTILAKSCLTCDTYENLDRIKCPTFVIGAKEDKVVTGEASLELAEKLGCRLHLYENMGHAAYIEEKNYNRIIFDFLTEAT